MPCGFEAIHVSVSRTECHRLSLDGIRSRPSSRPLGESGRLGRGSDILKCVNEVNQEHEVSPASAVVIDVRGGRYGEVFLLDTSSPTVTADVYNSYGLNDCPQDLWSALDPKQLAVDNGVGLVMLNGPRCWLMDNITKVQDLAQPREIRNFGGIDMFKAATLMIGDITAPPGPYSPRAVDRRTVFSFDHGSQIYELVDPAGTRWVMQSWSQQADPRLSVNDLPGHRCTTAPAERMDVCGQHAVVGVAGGHDHRRGCRTAGRPAEQLLEADGVGARDHPTELPWRGVAAIGLRSLSASCCWSSSAAQCDSSPRRLTRVRGGKGARWRLAYQQGDDAAGA